MIDENDILVLTNDDGKVCRKCGQRLPTTRFWRSRTASDTLQPWCIDCQKEYKGMHYLAIKADNLSIRDSTIPDLIRSVQNGMSRRELKLLLKFTGKLQTIIEKQL